MYNIPARDTVAGVAVRKLDISNNNRIAGVRAIRSLLAKVKTLNKTNLLNNIANYCNFTESLNITLLSSITVFKDSIHMGSISPSNTIHFGLSPPKLACSLISTENKPGNHDIYYYILFDHV